MDTFDKDHSFGRICKIIPEKHVKSLSLRWVMPPSKMFNKKKSCAYLSHVIGHEGPNSLLSSLVRQDLAISLSAGSSHRLNHAIE